MRKIKILFFVVILFLTCAYAVYNTDDEKAELKAKTIYDLIDSPWVDSVYNSMTTEERIAQLLMIRVNLNEDSVYYSHIDSLVSIYKVGGICLFKGKGLVKQVSLTNHFQSISKVPLLVSIDAEWGLAMRLDSTISFPRQMMLGAIHDDSLVYEFGKEMARQCKRMGIHINFAPVVDINSNPLNPVINSRSFGENKYNVVRKGIMYMNGMQDNGIIACAKHFPGHGDTDKDSHKDLPVIGHSKEYMDSVDLFPFRELISRGLNSIMVAHLYVPAYDTSKNTATTLSRIVVTDLLKNKMNFKGLVFTDALNMKGVSSFNKPGELEVKALIAGNDVLLLPEDVPKAVSEIKAAADSGRISYKDIEEKCRKILAAKKWAGLDNYKPVKIKNIYDDLNNTEARFIRRKLIESSVTVLKNNDIIPLKINDSLKYASVAIGTKNVTPFQQTLSNNIKIDNYNIKSTASYSDIKLLVNKLSKYDYVIIGIHNTNYLVKDNYGITQKSIDFIDLLKQKTKVILDIFAVPYCLERFSDNKNIEALIISYQDEEIIQRISAEVILGGVQAKGSLPVSCSVQFPVNSGLNTDKAQHLIVTSSDAVGIPEEQLSLIDSMAINGIKARAYPGCQILAVKDGKIFYYKSFGYHTYDSIRPVKNTDIYDLASVTKVAATTLAAMKLYDEGKLNVDSTLVKYLPYLKGSNKADIVIRDMMAHQARLKDWIPFYLRTVKNGKPDPDLYSKVKTSKFPYRVADSMYIRKDYRDTIVKRIVESRLCEKKEYKYSDLGFYFLMQIVDSVTGKTLDEYVRKNFYIPMNLRNTAYCPRKYFSLERIVPTEYDKNFRGKVIQGDVHDPGAAMLGGVCGHAGLFSDAYDLAVIMQMLLQGGVYDGRRYLQDSTVKKFTSYQFPENDNRRGLGFDKPFINDEGGPACNSASKNSFGHSGFTGTYVWADPDENLIFVFLSNRVYPDAENDKILKMNIRTDIQQLLYDIIRKTDMSERKDTH